MSMETITIYRALPVRNGYVQVPPCRETDKSRVTVDDALSAIPGSVSVMSTQGSGPLTGSKFGQQEVLWLPGIAPQDWYASDPVAAIQ